jgi:hypothetical protein
MWISPSGGFSVTQVFRERGRKGHGSGFRFGVLIITFNYRLKRSYSPAASVAAHHQILHLFSRSLLLASEKYPLHHSQCLSHKSSTCVPFSAIVVEPFSRPHTFPMVAFFCSLTSIFLLSPNLDVRCLYRFHAASLQRTSSVHATCFSASNSNEKIPRSPTLESIYTITYHSNTVYTVALSPSLSLSASRSDRIVLVEASYRQHCLETRGRVGVSNISLNAISKMKIKPISALFLVQVHSSEKRRIA